MTLLRAVLACGCALWRGTGCVAVPIGKTEEFRHELPWYETGKQPVRTTLERARVDLRQRGTVAEVSVDADVIEEYAQWCHLRQITVRRQKRLAFGLFPGAAELVWMPKGALVSAMGADKAVALAAGAAPPAGAVSRCLEERYENGMLSVEFEVLAQ